MGEWVACWARSDKSFSDEDSRKGEAGMTQDETQFFELFCVFSKGSSASLLHFLSPNEQNSADHRKGVRLGSVFCSDITWPRAHDKSFCMWAFAAKHMAPAWTLLEPSRTRSRQSSAPYRAPRHPDPHILLSMPCNVLTSLTHASSKPSLDWVLSVPQFASTTTSRPVSQTHTHTNTNTQTHTHTLTHTHTHSGSASFEGRGPRRVARTLERGNPGKQHTMCQHLHSKNKQGNGMSRVCQGNKASEHRLEGVLPECVHTWQRLRGLSILGVHLHMARSRLPHWTRRSVRLADSGSSC